MHLALQRDIGRSFDRQSRKRGRVHCLAPDVLALRNWVENSVPAAGRIKDGHVQHQHRVMPAPARAKPLSRFFRIFGLHCNYFLSVECSRLVANSANTSAQKIDTVIMVGPPNRPHSRLAPTASARSSSATFELRVRKAFPVRAAIRRSASRRERVRAQPTELLIAESCDVLNFSCDTMRPKRAACERPCFFSQHAHEAYRTAQSNRSSCVLKALASLPEGFQIREDLLLKIANRERHNELEVLVLQKTAEPTGLEPPSLLQCA